MAIFLVQISINPVFGRFTVRKGVCGYARYSNSTVIVIQVKYFIGSLSQSVYFPTNGLQHLASFLVLTNLLYTFKPISIFSASEFFWLST